MDHVWTITAELFIPRDGGAPTSLEKRSSTPTTHWCTAADTHLTGGLTSLHPRWWFKMLNEAKEPTAPSTDWEQWSASPEQLGRGSTRRCYGHRALTTQDILQWFKEEVCGKLQIYVNCKMKHT